jgi:aldehyde dehydrogenase (NAD+)
VTGHPPPHLLTPHPHPRTPSPSLQALLIGPWNFPLQLLLVALVGAVAAGNAAVIKPSEVSPACAALLGSLIPKYLDAAAVRVVQGAVPETTALLEQRWDVIWYTGNAAVARVVAAAAARHLTPTILELGGKCPAIVAADADIDLAAKHIVSGKFVNAGQVCLAPDYVLVEAGAEARLLDALKRTVEAFYGPDPQASPSLGRIVNGRHWARVRKLLDGHGGTVVCGGGGDEGDRYFAPTVLSRPSPDAAIMREEIFGPLLPVLPVPSVDAALRFVTDRAREKPLALYAFTSSSSTAHAVLAGTSSGSVAINDCVMQVANCDLPFGGVGESGMGSYHGAAGFTAFSHRKSVYRMSTLVDMGRLRYPPYTDGQVRLVGRLLTALPSRLPQLGWRDVLLGGLAAAVIALSVELARAKGQW